MNTNDIWLIAGLGNPETKYDGTRHNAGFAALDASGRQVEHLCWQDQISGPVGTGRGGRPQGGAAEAPDLHEPLRRFHRPHGGLFQDPCRPCAWCCAMISRRAPGKLRIRPSGSAGGHNGLKSIIARLGRGELPPHPHRHRRKAPPGLRPCRMGAGQVPGGGCQGSCADRYPDLEAAAKLIMDGKLSLAQSKYNG